jgi:hypothetical protein
MSSPFIPVDVILHTYDLSMGAARSISMMLLGTQIDLIPHTGIVFRNLEYFFGGGIKALPPSEVVEVFGLQPVERLNLGKTYKTEEELQVFLRQISSRFTMESYDLFSNNCNHFSGTLSSFLVGVPIPSRITDIPRLVLSTPMGALLGQTMTGMNNRFGAMTGGDPFSALAESSIVSRHEISSSARITKGELLSVHTNVLKSSLSTETLLLSSSILEVNDAFIRLQQLFNEEERLKEFEILKQFIITGMCSDAPSENVLSFIVDTIKSDGHDVPAYYILRVLVLSETCFNVLRHNGFVDSIVISLLAPRNNSSRSIQATILALTIVSNSLALGSSWLSNEKFTEVSRIISIHLSDTSSSVRIAAAILALNIINDKVVGFNPTTDMEFVEFLLNERGLLTESNKKCLHYRLIIAGRLIIRLGDEVKPELLLAFCQSLGKITHHSVEITELVREVLNICHRR